MITLIIHKYVYAILILISGIACNSSKANVKQSSNITAGKDTIVVNGCQDKIKVSVGSILEFQLEAIPVIGYEWIVLDSSDLLEAHRYDVLNYKDRKEGSFQQLFFKAKTVGEDTIHFEYKRVFETKVKSTCSTHVEIYE